MARKSIFGIVSSRTQAEQIVDRLKEACIADNDISVFFSDIGRMWILELAEKLKGMGLPRDVAKRYEDRLGDGAILISVHNENLDEIDQAADILEENGAQGLFMTRDFAPSRKPMMAAGFGH